MLIRFFTSSLAAGLIFAALALAPAAAGHGGGGAALGYSSTITSVRPDVPGVSLRVLDGDDRLLLVNEGKDDVVVLGYEGEPYLRITPEAAFANVRSPTHYLNEDRYAAVELPPTADAQALPEWRMIDDEPRGEWHDHRIHWMSATAPPAVLEDPESPHEILEWTVPLEAGGRPIEVSGTLAYEPVDEGGLSPMLIVLLVFPPLVAVGVTWRRRRRDRKPAAPT